MHIFTTLAHQPELFRRWLGFGGALLGGKLSGRIRELVILRTAYRFNGRYEWAHHIELGERQGISAAETAALGGDLSDVEWDPFERAVLAAVDETADDGEVSDAHLDHLVRPAQRRRSGRAPHAAGPLPDALDRVAIVTSPA